MKIINYLILITGLCFFVFSCSNPEDNSESNKKTDTSEVNKAKTTQNSISEDLEGKFQVQDLFENEISDVINALAMEDFSLALKKTEKCLSDKNISETQKAALRYMHIYSVAGLVTEKKMTHDDLNKILTSYKGQYLITQNLEITKGISMPFNQLQVEKINGKKLEATCSNNAGVNIHCFINVNMKNALNLDKQLGKHGYICGKLKTFKTSENDVFSWICEIELDEGFVKILEDEYEKIDEK